MKLPAIWAFGGIALMPFGMIPRWMNGASYGVWVLFILLEILWKQQTVSDVLYMASPFSWVNPMREQQPGELVLLTAVAAALAEAGNRLFCRRDAVLK